MSKYNYITSDWSIGLGLWIYVSTLIAVACKLKKHVLGCLDHQYSGCHYSIGGEFDERYWGKKEINANFKQESFWTFIPEVTPLTAEVRSACEKGRGEERRKWEGSPFRRRSLIQNVNFNTYFIQLQHQLQHQYQHTQLHQHQYQIWHYQQHHRIQCNINA